MSKHPSRQTDAAHLPDPASFGLPPAGVETHAHLNGKAFAADREKVLERARAAGIARLGLVFLGTQEWNKDKDFFGNFPEIFFTLGVHPTDAPSLTAAELAGIRAAAASDRRIKALGEMGLDYYWKDIPPTVQKEAFRQQLHLAKELALPVVIHCREAVEDTLALLMAENFKNYPLLWHCFGGDSSLALRLLDLGWHLSIPGTVTFPSNRELRAALRHIPVERLVLETDCPYLAPMPFRGQRNEPAFLAFTAQMVAESKDMNPAELWRACGRTAMDFFGLEPLA
ncbi:MAG: TatD family hydrolase [Deltaproteobacteria bacterium]|jgi:TatD DNase family protein|nr:TatD family hydrolase [Deltaproteobacteria bacterium]